VANVLLSEVGGRLKALGLEQEQSPVSMAGIVQAADLLDEGKISSKQLKQLFDVCFEKGEDFAAVYEREKPQQITDASAIEALIDEVIAANPKQVEQYRAGKKTMAGFFVGQVMKASKGQANPALLNELVTKKLEGEATAFHECRGPSAYFSFSSTSNSLRVSQELTVLTALFLPPFSAQSSKSSAIFTWAKRNRPFSAEYSCEWPWSSGP
jgi:hypothetical protein